jgi:hypothetical protein
LVCTGRVVAFTEHSKPWLIKSYARVCKPVGRVTKLMLNIAHIVFNSPQAMRLQSQAMYGARIVHVLAELCMVQPGTFCSHYKFSVLVDVITQVPRVLW